jgi:hypothetical protein
LNQHREKIELELIESTERNLNLSQMDERASEIIRNTRIQLLDLFETVLVTESSRETLPSVFPVPHHEITMIITREGLESRVNRLGTEVLENTSEVARHWQHQLELQRERTTEKLGQQT